jgi:hypothetical protein
MSRRDTYHYAVRRALVKDGWTISHDPLRLSYEGTTVSTDLGAERLVADGQRIAVEIIAVEVKDFDSEQMMSDFEKALGQYNLYRTLLKLLDPDRAIFLAVRNDVFDEFFQRPIIQVVTEEDKVCFLIFDEVREEIVQWIR